MKKLLTLAVIFLIILSSFVASSPRVKASSSLATIRVPQDYATIQEAINAANPGDTVLVAGTYNEHVMLDKSLLLKGESPDTATLNGYIVLTADSSEVTGFTIQNDWQGASLEGVSFAKIYGNVFLSYLTAINVKTSTSCDIFDNTIQGSEGIIIQGRSRFLSLVNNTIRGSESHGIYITGSSRDITMRRNKLINNTYNFGVTGAGPLQDFIHDIDSSNTINGKPMYYLINQTNLVIDDGTYLDIGYLAVVNSKNITIRNISIENNVYGIQLPYTNGSLIENTTIGNVGIGIELMGAHLNTVKGNVISAHERGILFSEESTIEGNKISLRGSRDPSSKGIYIGRKNLIIGNTVADSPWLGLFISGSDNSIYHNDFINNTVQARMYSDGLVNAWDNGSRGNYWSNYAGVDADGDRIGDTPYIIDGYNQDNYPVMYTSTHEPWDKSAVIVDPLYCEHPNDNLISEISEYLVSAGYTISAVMKSTDVTIEWLKEGLRHGAVFWRGHGTEGSSLITCEEVTPETEMKYAEDIAKGYVFCYEGHWAFTGDFIRHYYKGYRFQYSLIYAEACYGLKSEFMAQAFVECGVGSYVGYRGRAWAGPDLLPWSADKHAKQFFDDTCLKGYTVEQAVDDLHTVWDPFCSLDWYGHNDLRLISESEDTRSLVAALYSPAELYLTDPEGHHVGLDPETGKVVNEIPNAIYSGGPDWPEGEPRVVWIPEVSEGSYDFRLLSTATGDFTFKIGTSSISETVTETYTGSVEIGQVLTSTIEVSEEGSDSTEPEHVLPSISSHKDKMVDHIGLELDWLTITVGQMDIKEDAQEGLLDKLSSATLKIDQAKCRIDSGNETQANNVLNAAKNVVSAFIKQVDAQTEKGMTGYDANSLVTVAQTIVEDIEIGINIPI